MARVGQWKVKSFDYRVLIALRSFQLQGALVSPMLPRAARPWAGLIGELSGMSPSDQPVLATAGDLRRQILRQRLSPNPFGWRVDGALSRLHAAGLVNLYRRRDDEKLVSCQLTSAGSAAASAFADRRKVRGLITAIPALKALPISRAFFLFDSENAMNAAACLAIGCAAVFLLGILPISTGAFMLGTLATPLALTLGKRAVVRSMVEIRRSHEKKAGGLNAFYQPQREPVRQIERELTEPGAGRVVDRTIELAKGTPARDEQSLKGATPDAPHDEKGPRFGTPEPGIHIYRPGPGYLN